MAVSAPAEVVPRPVDHVSDPVSWRCLRTSLQRRFGDAFGELRDEKDEGAEISKAGEAVGDGSH